MLILQWFNCLATWSLGETAGLQCPRSFWDYRWIQTPFSLFPLLTPSRIPLKEGDGTPLQYSFLEKSQGRRSLVGCSPWGLEESDMTEWLHFHFSLSFIGEGNGSPLQWSCLDNPRDGGSWWAAVYQVTQSWTRLKRLSSSSSSRIPQG